MRGVPKYMSVRPVAAGLWGQDRQRRPYIGIIRGITRFQLNKLTASPLLRYVFLADLIAIIIVFLVPFGTTCNPSALLSGGCIYLSLYNISPYSLPIMLLVTTVLVFSLGKPKGNLMGRPCPRQKLPRPTRASRLLADPVFTKRPSKA